MRQNDLLENIRAKQHLARLWHLIREELIQRFSENEIVVQRLKDIESEILGGYMTAGQGADELLDLFLKTTEKE